MDPTSRSRRSALRLGCAALSGAFAGCSTLKQSSEGLRLGDIVLRHYPPEPHTVRLELERAGEFVLEESYELSEGEKQVIQPAWPRSPAVYRLYTVVEGPLDSTDDPFDLFTNEFTNEDSRSDGNTCSVVDIQIGAPPNPGDVAISIGTPGPEGFGNCENDSPSGE